MYGYRLHILILNSAIKRTLFLLIYLDDVFILRKSIQLEANIYSIAGKAWYLYMKEQQELIEKFLDYLSLERGLAYNTIVSYRYDLSKFLEFIVNNKNTSLKLVNREIITEYYQYLASIKLGINSIFRHLVALKMLYRFLFIEGFIKIDLTNFIEFPRLEKKLPRVLSLKELDRLLSEENFSGILGKRDQAILELLYATGMRVSELIGLRTNNINLEHLLLKCIGKGSKERWLPFTNRVHDILDDYIKYARPRLLKDRDTNILFVNSHGKPITRQGVFYIIKNYVQKSGLKIIHGGLT